MRKSSQWTELWVGHLLPLGVKREVGQDKTILDSWAVVNDLICQDPGRREIK